MVTHTACQQSGKAGGSPPFIRTGSDNRICRGPGVPSTRLMAGPGRPLPVDASGRVQDRRVVNHLQLVAGESLEHRLHYWSPLVDGRPLREILVDAVGDEFTDTVIGDTVPVLIHSWPVGLTKDASVLLGETPPELVNGRIPIFVCPECGDLGCGAITAEVERDRDTVIWRDLGWDVNYETEDEGDIRFYPGPLVFDRAQYESELRRFIETFDQVRASLPAHLQHTMAGNSTQAAPRRWWRPRT